jgi:hypothetical protein
MKNLEVPGLHRISQFLEHVDCGEYVVRGNLEAYSVKLNGLDKKLSQSLESEFQLEYASSPHHPDYLAMSPVGPMSDAQNRKTLAYLILVLNQIYPDYDFSKLRAQHFIKQEGGLEQAEEVAEERLVEVSEVWDSKPISAEGDFQTMLWTGINEAIDLRECDIYR